MGDDFLDLDNESNTRSLKKILYQKTSKPLPVLANSTLSKSDFIAPKNAIKCLICSQGVIHISKRAPANELIDTRGIRCYKCLKYAIHPQCMNLNRELGFKSQWFCNMCSCCAKCSVKSKMFHLGCFDCGQMFHLTCIESELAKYRGKQPWRCKGCDQFSSISARTYDLKIVPSLVTSNTIEGTSALPKTLIKPQRSRFSLLASNPEASVSADKQNSLSLSNTKTYLKSEGNKLKPVSFISP